MPSTYKSIKAYVCVCVNIYTQLKAIQIFIKSKKLLQKAKSYYKPIYNSEVLTNCGKSHFLKVDPSRLDLVRKVYFVLVLLCVFMVKHLKHVYYVCVKWVCEKDRIWQVDKFETTNQTADIGFLYT